MYNTNDNFKGELNLNDSSEKNCWERDKVIKL